MQPIFTVINIKSCYASWSSSDVSMKKKGGPDAELLSELDFDMEIYPEVIAHIANDTSLLTSNFNLFFQVKDDDMQKRIDYWESFGFQKNEKEYDQLVDALCERQEKEEETNRINAGYLIPMGKLDKELKPIYEFEHYKGGFSDAVFNSPYTKQYIVEDNRLIPHGYWGHECRKIWVDQMMEDLLSTLLTPDQFSIYLKCSHARHFSDGMSQLIDDEDKQATLEYIVEHIESIYNKAVVYSHPDFQSDKKTAEQVKNEMAKKGLLKDAKEPKSVLWTQDVLNILSKHIKKGE
jgi:hypothetical protein